jgi:hypothetical protein
MNIRIVSMVVIVSALGACTPYHSNYMCARSTDYGKCSDVRGAYDNALQASPPERAQRGEPVKARSTRKDKKALPNPAAMDVVQARDLYRAREYQQLAELLEQPVVPLVKAPTALRTLVLSYSTGKTLYMPRYVYYLDNEATFVLGDYLNPRDGGGQMMFPNGAKQK